MPRPISCWKLTRQKQIVRRNMSPSLLLLFPALRLKYLVGDRFAVLPMFVLLDTQVASIL